jgi:Cof subfamily protein (haloacid dehalogenase superfamily)
MQDIKLLILDIDGTIAGQSNQVSDITKQAIRKIQAQGVRVGLATGRMYCSAKRFHREIQAQLPIIAYNGAWIQDPETNEIISHRPVKAGIAQQLLTYFRQPHWGDSIEVHLYFNDNLYVEKLTRQTDSYLERSGITVRVVDDFSSLLRQNPTKVLALSSNADLITQMLTELKQEYQDKELYLTQSNPIYLEATQAEVNKGEAVKYLAEKILGIKPSEIMAIGDNFNDLAMLEYVGTSIAMGDAPALIKDRVDWVAPDVENHGVAEAIAQFFKI